MASVLADHPSRSRWFSPKPSRLSTRRKPATDKSKSTGVFNLNALASILGLRSKKQHPVLAIQNPPVFSEQPPPSSTPHFSVKYANRPPSNSTLRSSVDLQTPLVTPKDPLPLRQSLLTLSDSDPFASQGQIRFLQPFAVSSILSVSSQLSVDSPAVPSNQQAEIATSSTRETHETTPSTPLADPSRLAPCNSITALESSPAINTSKSGSFSTLTDSRRVNDSSVPSPNPAIQLKEGAVVLKARLEPSTSQKSGTSGSRSPASPPASTRPHISRQLSASRIGRPPTAPPAHSLPPPPLELAVDDLVSFILPSDSSPSSSLLSFTSSLHHDYDNPSQSFRPRREVRAESYATLRNLSQVPKDVDQSSPHLPKSSRYSLTSNLKKAASHQSFSSKRESVSSVGTHEETSEKHPRKYRSFQHRRPHSNRNSLRSDSSNFLSFGSHASIRDFANKGATNSSPTPNRIRLFSGSGILRPSTSPGHNHDPDARSILSLPLDNEHSRDVLFPTSSKPKSQTTSSLHESIRDEPLQAPPPPPGSPEYIPQHILSPAEMLEVEASIEAATDEYLRGRRSRAPSSSTTHSVKYPSDTFSAFSLSGGYSSPGSLRASVDQSFASTEGGRAVHTPHRSSSIRSKERPPLHIRIRPSTAHASLTAPTSPISSLRTSSPVCTEPPLISLPPPPRPKPRRPLTFNDNVVSFVPLSPRPRRGNTMSNSFLEGAMMRRSILRKPSFLEIEDDIEKDGDQRLEESFLDLNRESFDTLRSSEQDEVFPPPLIL